MALRGNLKDFSLPDVFQLVAFSRKTGVLRIVREDGGQGSVWFRDGDVFFASSDWQSEPIGQRLVDAGRIAPDSLDRALAIRRAEPEGGRRLGQILVDEGYITDSVIEAFVSEQIQDTIFDLMRWEEGVFDFETMREAIDEDIGLSVSIENVIMEGARRLDEWNRIKRKIPSSSVVFKMATAPGEGTLEISLKPVEWQMLLLIDGTRSVADLIAETDHTDFEIARVLYGLFSAGLLDFATDEEVAKNKAERAQRDARLARSEAEQRGSGREAASAPAVRLVTEPEPADEVPAFLDLSSAPSAADDQAELEEFLGSVLQPTEQGEPPVPREQEPIQEQATAEPPSPAEPVIEPSAGPRMPLVQVPSVEDLAVGSEPADEREVGPAPVASADTRLPDWLIEPGEGAPIPEWMKRPDHVRPMQEPVWVGPSRGTQEAPPEPPAPVPEPLTPAPEPESEAPPAAQPEPEVPQAARAEPEPPDTLTPEPEGPGFVAVPYVLDVGDGLVVEPLAEVATDSEESPSAERSLETSIADEGGSTLSDLQALVESLDEQVEAPLAVESADVESLDAPDFSELMESLDVGTDAPIETTVAEFESAATPSIAEPEIAPTIMDDEPVVEMPEPPIEIPEPEPATPEVAESAIEVAEPEATTPEVAEPPIEIPEPETAAPLTEPIEEPSVDLEPASASVEVSEDVLESDQAPFEVIGMDELGFSEGLGDELSALTGAGGRKSGRPKVSVKKLPEGDGAVLKRDARVDKETLLRIIDGINNL